MKKIFFTAIVLTAIILFSACNGSQKQGHSNKATMAKNDAAAPGAIRIYYFHGSIRCHTCVSVDENTHQYLKELFPVKMDKGEIVFQSINIDKDERPDLVKKYQIYGQTLLFIKSDKVIDKTDDAFQYVTTNPEKWKQLVKKTIHEMM